MAKQEKEIGKEEQAPAVKLTDKQLRFCEEYLVDLNATQAAIRAGYSEKTAYSIGWENLRKPDIKDWIKDRLAELSLSAAETQKLISDIARASLNDYFIVKQVLSRPKVKKHLSEVIADTRLEMEKADKFIQRAGISEEKAMEAHHAEQERRRHQIIRYEIDLESNPAACLITEGEPEMKTVAELDLAKLVQDKNAGRIRTVKPTEFGLTVELYPADGALRDIARMHGLFEKDNDQQTKTITVNIE